MSFLGEIKRRKVFQVAAVYALVAWLIIQVIDVISEPLSLPGWIDTVVIVLLAVGLPIAVILAWAFEVTPEGVSRDVGGRGTSTQSAAQRFGYISQALVLLAVGFLIIDQYVLDLPTNTSADSGSLSSADTYTRRYSIQLGETEPISIIGHRIELALSPNGQHLAYWAQVDSLWQIYLRNLSTLESVPISGAEQGRLPFFSPDGERIAYRNLDGGLATISIRGGEQRTLATGWRGGTGGTWSKDNYIYFTRNDALSLHRIHADGGEIEELEVPSRRPGEAHSWPQVLPDGAHLLFTLIPEGLSAREGRIVVRNLLSGAIQPVIDGGYHATYTTSGHIVFMRTGDLWAVPFDLERLVKTGDEVLVVRGIETAGTRGQAAYAVSESGLLVYLPGIDTQVQSTLTLNWTDQLDDDSLLHGFAAFEDPRISPDGSRLAIAIEVDGQPDVYIYDFDSESPTRLTFGGGKFPVWTPDGTDIVFWSPQRNGLFSKSADGRGQEVRLTSSDGTQEPDSISQEGHLVYREGQVFGGQERLAILDLANTASREGLIESDTRITASDLSPDGQWIAYSSGERGAGEFRISIHPFPEVGAGGTWQVPSGGTEPRWSSDGSALFYRFEDAIWSVEVEFAAEGIQFGDPRRHESGNLYGGIFTRNYDISSVGQRLLVIQDTGISASGTSDQQTAKTTTLVAVENWFEELNRLAPPTE